MDLIINFFEKRKFLLFIIILIIVGCFVIFAPLSSFRNLTSDSITISSILLAILGIFLGILLNLKDDSIFFRRAKAFDQDERIFFTLLNLIVKNFFLNIVFVVGTLLYDVAPQVESKFFKSFINIFWMSLFFFLIIGTCYIVYLISEIYNFQPESNETRVES